MTDDDYRIHYADGMRCCDSTSVCSVHHNAFLARDEAPQTEAAPLPPCGDKHCVGRCDRCVMLDMKADSESDYHRTDQFGVDLDLLLNNPSARCSTIGCPREVASYYGNGWLGFCAAHFEHFEQWRSEWSSTTPA